MKTHLRPLVADAPYPTIDYSLLALCERYDLEPDDGDEALSSKRRYVMGRQLADYSGL